MIEIVAKCHPEPQGSVKAFVIKGRAVLTSDNPKLKQYRREVARCAQAALMGSPAPRYGQHQPVELEIVFSLLKPPSAPRRRTHAVVKPDVDKLLRATLDSLTGIIYHDDAQVVGVVTRKVYAEMEGVSIIAREVKAT